MGMKPPLHAQFPDGKYAAGTAAPLEPAANMRNFSLSEIIELLKTDQIDLSIETNRRRLRHYLERLVQYEKFAQACNDARAHLPHDLPKDWSTDIVNTETTSPEKANADSTNASSINHALHCARIVERSLGRSAPATTSAEEWAYHWWNLKIALDDANVS